MTRIAYLVTSATILTLADGSDHPTGYFAEEVIKPYERFVAAGLDVVVITPDGNAPTADPYGLSWFFHYPEADKDYLASVVRTFRRDVDDIRFTLHQNTELDLGAARRIAELLGARGLTAAQAHAVVSRAAKRSWLEDIPLRVTIADDPEGEVLQPDEVLGAIEAQKSESKKLAQDRERRIQADPKFQHPVALPTLTEEDFDSFDALFAPGGHGPMVDLYDNADVGRLLTNLHRRGAVISSICHGPAIFLSAPERPDGQWLFDGYRMTCFTDEEEDQTEAGRLGMAWYLDVAIKNAGAVYDDGPSAWSSHFVVDRNVITGQNPSSSEATADAVIRAVASLTTAKAA